MTEAQSDKPEIYTGEDAADVPGSEDTPSHEVGTPPLSGEDQEQGQTSHPAPADDFGVGPYRGGPSTLRSADEEADEE